MIDQLAALDQAESHFRSENIKFGIRHRMRSGKTVLNHTQFLGYTKGPDGVLQIVPEEAEVVRKIFELYVQGNGVRKIKRHLEEHGIKTVTGKSEWSTSTIDRMLSNESKRQISWCLAQVYGMRENIIESNKVPCTLE
ncbi:MAG: hypothetical protein HFF25_08000 [Oscillospiraceae bacterium]|nr:hypothetical protein [Oscillospiraceae bacterium]MCI9551476.1 hypothetical protein [Oscillospiraceae bacterium]